MSWICIFGNYWEIPDKLYLCIFQQRFCKLNYIPVSVYLLVKVGKIKVWKIKVWKIMVGKTKGLADEVWENVGWEDEGC